MEQGPEKLPLWKLIIFALGQLGWSLASYSVSNLIMYFYMPPETASAQRIFPPFIFEGAVLGLFTIIGIINFVARFFDAVTNPLLASWSDRSHARMGRRRYFLAISAVPFAFFSYLVFLPLQHFAQAPSLAASWLNIVWLCGSILLFYFFYVMYFAPYNALISELGHNPKERLIISTVIAVTWSLGFATGNFIYDFQGMLEKSGMNSVQAFQHVQLIFAVVSAILMLLPPLFINERRYAAYSVSDETTAQALRSSLRNKNFLRFIVSEFLYNICQTIIQMGIVYYIVTLLKLEKELTSLLMMVMFILSFVFYPFITAAAVRWEKKRVVIVGFALLALLFVIFSLYGIVPVPPLVLAFFTVGAAAIPIAIFTIVPNAIVADIAEADGLETGNFKAGMFFGVRSFESNLGVSVANMLFPSLLLLGMTVDHPLGIRMSAIVSVLICLAGLGVFFLYDEKEVLRSLATKEALSAAELQQIEAGHDARH
ncbi:MAG TPA: MFS transporter [Rectinemataceae bacterium]|nr:MFS transporter [Rectinemataceae bacterium]